MFGLKVLLLAGLAVGSSSQLLDLRARSPDESRYYSVPKTCQTTFDRVCCLGYIENPYNTSLCVPLCEGGCSEYSVCTAPNVCQCKTNTLRASNKCLPVCPRGDAACFSGHCLGKNCICPGAAHGGTYQCLATCRHSCPFTQTCVDKDTCGCENGFTLEDGRCKAYCERSCAYGECVAPNTCRCHAGGILVNGVCEAVCWQNCKNGKCVRPNVCQCNEGYLLKIPELYCTPKCPGCELGVCQENGHCICPPGLKYFRDKCEIKCTACGNYGTCGENGGCICDNIAPYSTIFNKCCRYTGNPFACPE